MNDDVKRLTGLRSQMEALYEPTGIPGPALFCDRLQQSIFLSRRENTVMVLLLVRLDLTDLREDERFTASDVTKCIAEAVSRLKASSRVSDTVGHLGDDLFGINFSSVHLSGFQGLTMRILSSLEAPYEVSGERVTIPVKLGAAVRDVDCTTFELMLAQAHRNLESGAPIEHLRLAV